MMAGSVTRRGNIYGGRYAEQTGIGKLSRMQIENATTEELYRLIEQTEAELTRRELHDRELPPTAG